MKYRIRCTDCLVVTTDPDVVQDPRGPDEWRVCRNCRLPEHFETLCFVEDCNKAASCGTPSGDGYKFTCSDHKPKV